MNKRQQFTELFERNRNLVFDFRKDYKEYLERTNFWNEPAFTDSQVSHRIYYDEFVKFSDVEYSEAQCNAIKTVEIPDSSLDQFMAGLNQQYESLSLIYDDLKRKSNL